MDAAWSRARKQQLQTDTAGSQEVIQCYSTRNPREVYDSKRSLSKCDEVWEVPLNVDDDEIKALTHSPRLVILTHS